MPVRRLTTAAASVGVGGGDDGVRVGVGDG